MTTSSEDKLDLDSIIVELGNFRRFHVTNYILILLPIMLTGGIGISFVFTTGQLDYRCKIPQCEQELSSSIEYLPNWLPNAIPHVGDLPTRCGHYEYLENNLSNGSCGVNSFNTSNIVQCEEYIFRTDEITIVNEFGITCDENEWKLTTVGTVNNFAQFVVMPFIGYLSDRFGRRNVFVCGVIFSGLFGIVKSFSINYPMLLVFQLLEATFDTGVYSSVFIYAVELVGPEGRVFVSVLVACAFTIGPALVGVIAMLTQNFRTMLQIFYAPAFLCITYFWIMPESVRWLVSRGRKIEAISVIYEAAKTNKITLAAETQERIDNFLKDETNEELKVAGSESDIIKNEHFNDIILAPNTNNDLAPKESLYVKEKNAFLQALSSKVLRLRLLISAVVWFTITYVYYGLSLNSVALGGNKYLNFILTSLVEIPAQVVTFVLMDRIGRRWLLFVSLVVSGGMCIGSEFFPDDSSVWKLVFYLIGKGSITIALTVIYVYTAELYPTNLRHSLMSFCLTMGRIGAILSPQTPLLALLMPSLPLILFSAASFLAGIVCLFLPETLKINLPDTIAEAEAIGVKRKK